MLSKQQLHLEEGKRGLVVGTRILVLNILLSAFALCIIARPNQPQFS